MPLSSSLHQDVLISSPGLPDAQFIANRWLATDEGDKQTSVILYPFGTNGAAKAMHKYRIHVRGVSSPPTAEHTDDTYYTHTYPCRLPSCTRP